MQFTKEQIDEQFEYVKVLNYHFEAAADTASEATFALNEARLKLNKEKDFLEVMKSRVAPAPV
jgi:hypothetical protein